METQITLTLIQDFPPTELKSVTASAPQFSLSTVFVWQTVQNKTGKDQLTKWKAHRSETDVYWQKEDNIWLRHLNSLTLQRHWLSRRSVHSLCKPCCLRGDSLEFFRCQKLYLWRESTTEAFRAKAVSFSSWVSYRVPLGDPKSKQPDSTLDFTLIYFSVWTFM